MPQWLAQLLPVLMALASGGVLTELARKFRPKSEVRAAEADAEGRTMAAISAAFGSLTEHTQRELNELRERITLLEKDLALAKQSEAILTRENARLQEDLDRVRGERDGVQARNTQLAGELRQCNQVMESLQRNGARFVTALVDPETLKPSDPSV